MPRRKSEVNCDAKDSGIKRTDSVLEQSSEDGLFLMGTVDDRVRKIVTSQGLEVEVVTYTISCGQSHYYVDDFAPDNYFSVNEKVTIPVYIKAYKKKNGEVSYMLKLLKKDVKVTSRGTRF